MPADRLSAFLEAAVRDRELAARMLKEHPELLTARGLNGETPLHFLAVEGYAEAVDFLGAQGADPDAPNEFGDTALLDVATLGNEDVAAVLLRRGANPNATSRTRDCVLHAAVRSGSSRLTALLLEAGAAWDYRTELGESVWDAVEQAPARRREDLLGTLVRHGARRSEPEP